MTVTDPFLFIAGVLPLDFVNTELMIRGERMDLLRSEADLARWFHDAGLGRVHGKALDDVRDLRAHLRRTFLHLAAGGKLRPSDLAPLQGALASTPGTLTLDLQRLDFTPAAPPSALFVLARSAAEFLTTADLSLVKACEGPTCILLFYDTTKSHTRRWCRMAACGNREKVAAHYKRQRS